MNIRNKLIAISLVAAMGVSFTACSDSGSKDDSSTAVVETLSSEEIEQVAKHDLSFQVYDPNDQGGVQQDAVESSADGSGNDQGGNADAQSGDNNNAQGGDNNNANANDSNNNNNNNNNAQDGNNNNNSQSGGNNTNVIQSPADIGNNTVDLPEKTGLQVITGKKLIAQAYWMDLSEQADKIFNGEYLKAQFKIKDGVQDGIYPVTIEKADFSNWGDPDPQTVKFLQLDGAVVVGGDAEENKFTDSSEPQLLVSNVSGKAGDTVTVIFSVKNNPGVVGNILNFSYNGDALEFLGAESGADFDGTFSS